MAPYSTGIELILNASEATLQIGLTRDENPLCFQQWHLPARATEILAPALAHIFEALDIKAAGICRIACINGPGSFTGIRLVLATAAALRRVNGAYVAALDYMQALATTLSMQTGLLYGRKIYVFVNARRNLVHFQPFMSFGPQIPAQPLEEVILAEPREAISLVGPGKSFLCGSALRLYPQIFDPVRTGEGPAALPEACVFPELIDPSWNTLRLLARHGDYFRKDLTPKYIRTCDAVDNINEIAPKQGMKGSEALEALNGILNRAPHSAD